MTEEILSAINESVGTEVFGIWFLIGAAFVFFMQAGFAMVETGFTRAKNAGNIIMKKFVCPVCGYVHTGDTPPAECPVSGCLLRPVTKDVPKGPPA